MTAAGTDTRSLIDRVFRAEPGRLTASLVRLLGDFDLAEEMVEVLTVIYLVYNEGFFTTAGDAGTRRELVDDAEWLAALVAAALPDEPEPLALLGLIRLSAARWGARVGPGGEVVVLAEQDRARWDHRRIRSAVALIERAAATGRPGPYQLEAAIAAVHCESPEWAATDWAQLLALYDMLAAIDSSPVVRLNRAVVLSHTAGAAARAAVEALGGDLGRYHLFHATRASLLRALDRTAEAVDADAAALALTANPAERSLLSGRLGAAR